MSTEILATVPLPDPPRPSARKSWSPSGRLSRRIYEPESDYNHALWLDLKPLEALLCVFVLAGCIALHFPRVYYPIGLAIEVGLSLLSFATPVSGLLYLSAAQVIPDPPSGPLTSSQLAFSGFLVWQLLRGFWQVRCIWPLLKSVVPFFLLTSVLLLRRHEIRGVELLCYAVLTGAAASILVGQSGNRFKTCLLAFLFGQAVAASVFWMLKAGVSDPVQAFNTELFAASTAESTRMGTARGNANALGVPMALVVAGAISLWSLRPLVRSAKSWQLILLAAGYFAVALPPMVGSGSRGAFVALAAGVLMLLAAGAFRAEDAPWLLAGALSLALFLSFGWHRLGLAVHWSEMESRQEEQGGPKNLIGGREMEWKAAVNAIAASPIVGGGAVERLSFEEIPEMWASHSTYLDAALIGGLPGMALFVWFTLKPLVALWQRRRDSFIMSALAVYFVAVVSNGSTSAMQTKQFWMLWGILGVVLVSAQPSAKTPKGRSRPKNGRPLASRERSPSGQSHDRPAVA